MQNPTSHQSTVAIVGEGNVKDRSERSTPSGTARLFRLSKTRSHLAWWPLAAAALLAIVFLIRAPRLFAPIEEPGEPVVRGDETPLVAHATLVDGAIEIAWTAPENTDVSQVQLFTASGETLFDSESRGLRLVVLPGEMRDPRPEEPLFARITALDRARRVLARSGLIAVAAPPSSKP